MRICSYQSIGEGQRFIAKLLGHYNICQVFQLEAHALADSFQAEASTVAWWADRLTHIVGMLETTWEGRAQQGFMTDMRPAVRDTEQLASHLEALAQAARRIQVSETVRLWERVIDDR